MNRIIFMIGLCLMLYPVIYYVAPIGLHKKEPVLCEEHLEEEALGIVEIPTIGVSLPIYEGTKKEVLDKGIGHITWSSCLPGKEGGHSLLAGHSGLPGKQLFDRLHELKEGDIFSLHIDGETLDYMVVTLQVIRPEETHLLGPAPGQDLVSLITCTPYGINTHRLIVTGERMEVKP